MQTAGSVNLSGKRVTVSVVTDNENLPTLLSRLSIMLLIPPPETTYSKHVTMTFQGGRELLENLGIFTADMTRVEGIKDGMLRHENEKRSYVRGAFLGSGFLSTGKNNHMEIAFSGEKLRDEVVKLLPSAIGSVGKGNRSGRSTIYFKSKEKISDMLVFMGATKASLALQEEMLVSSIEKKVTATQNCDVANIDRAISASIKQIEAINKIDGDIGLENLDEKLQTTAYLRKSYPEANISELADMLGVSKSCIAHRLEKLLSLANKQK